MTARDCIWLHVTLQGCMWLTWLHVNVQGCTWLYMTARDCIWLHVTVHDYTWLYTTARDCTGLHVTVNDCTWLYMTAWLYRAARDCTWLYMTARDFVAVRPVFPTLPLHPVSRECVWSFPWGIFLLLFYFLIILLLVLVSCLSFVLFHYPCVSCPCCGNFVPLHTKYHSIFILDSIVTKSDFHWMVIDLKCDVFCK
jgi:hypothetical protein